MIIFGTKDLAEMSKFYFETSWIRETVDAFIQDGEYIKEDTFCNLPVIPFEEVEEHFPPDETRFFAPMSGAKMNTIRERVYLRIKEKGYTMPTFIHEKAHVWDTTAVGENCFIQELNNIQYGTTVGNNVMMWAGNHIGHHGRIESHTFFTSHVVLSGHCTVGPWSWVGVNSTIKDFTRIAEGSLIAMGASITKNTEAWKVHIGSPARAKGKSMEVDF